MNLAVALTALAVAVLDAVTKAWARHSLSGHPHHVLGPLWLRLQYNTGISFSLNSSGPLVTTVATVAIAVGVVLVGLNARRGLPTAGFGLLIGGGVANVVDRLAASPHEVTDFIAVSSLPVFNLADVAITAGFVLLILAALRGDRLVGR